METMPIKRILVPTDFSDAAGVTIPAAIVMARAFGASVELLHVTATVAVLPPPLDVVGFSALMPDLSRRVQEHLDKEAELLRAAGIACETHSADGSSYGEIIERAREMDADLIIMGTHGHGGLTHAVLGSVTERVLHKAHCAVMVVPVHGKGQQG